MEGKKIISADYLNFTNEILIKSGVDPEEAKIISNVLVWSDLIGRSTHGIWRLPISIKRFKKNLINSPCNYNIEQKSEATAVIDANSAFGQYIGHVAMSKAINMAEQFGVGVVGVKRANHWSTGAYYVELAAKSAHIGFAASNAIPKVSAYGGITPVIGTNPFAFSAPTRFGRSILADFSTSASPGAVVIKAKEEGTSIPEGLVIDKNGKYITDPNLASKGTVLPFGGAKGFCMGLMVEILAGVITGAGFSHGVASMYEDFERITDVGLFFISIDIGRFMPIEIFYDRLDSLITIIKTSKILPGFDEVLVPGETRWRYFDEQLKNGIYLDGKTLESLSKLAEDFKVQVPW